MAKNQSQKPGRDVRGGTGKRGAASGGRGSAASFSSGRSRGFAGGSGRSSSGKAGAKQASGRSSAAGRSSARPRADLVIGRRAAAEALAVGLPLRSALIQVQTGERDQALEALARQLEEVGCAVERVPRGKLDALAEGATHQGVILRAEPFAYASLSEVIAAAGDGDALVVVLDHVTDQGNLGAIIRTAEVVGAAGVVIPSARAAGVGIGAYKASAGAVLHLPVAQVPNLARAIEELQAAGFWACASTEHARQDVWSAPMGGRLALVMGSEGEGISRLVRQRCDFEARLPQRGRIESLNVAQATTVMCYEWLRRVSAEEGTEAGAAPVAADPGAAALAAEAAAPVPAAPAPAPAPATEPAPLDFSTDLAEGYALSELDF